MENSSLNLAHYHGRRAENHFKHFRYDKAIENHEKAASFTEEAMKSASSPHVLVSLKLQLQDHKRRVNLINLKKVMLDKYIKELERQRESDHGTKKRSPCSAGTLPSDQAEEASPRHSRQDSMADTSTSSILELDLQESTIMTLAPLELPPLLDFESFRFHRSDKSDI